MCTHAYSIPSGDKRFCLKCRAIVEVVEEDTQEFHAPPRIFQFTERLWEQTKASVSAVEGKPFWKYIPYRVPMVFDWYITMFGDVQYIIMPIWDAEGNIVYYSARRLTTPDTAYAQKYLYPTGVKKHYWVYTDSDHSPNEGNKMIICEGVADAAYCSFIGDSLSTLGSYLDERFNNVLANRDVAILFDGDAAGIIAATRIQAKIKGVAKSVSIIVLPNGADPTDIELRILKGMIYG